jgi:thiol-disulfide isomerase/thioredoxin
MEIPEPTFGAEAKRLFGDFWGREIQFIHNGKNTRVDPDRFTVPRLMAEHLDGLMGKEVEKVNYKEIDFPKVTKGSYATKILKSKGLVILESTSKSCTYCQYLKRELRDLLKANPNKLSVYLISADTDHKFMFKNKLYFPLGKTLDDGYALPFVTVYYDGVRHEKTFGYEETEDFAKAINEMYAGKINLSF